MYDATSKKEWLPYNSTFFESIWGVSYPKWKEWIISAQDLIQKVLSEITIWQKQYQRFIDTVLIWADDKTLIEKEWAQYIIDTLEMAKIAVPIELEKSSVKPLFSDTERESFVEQMNEYQTKIYGESLRENSIETLLTLQLIRKEWKEWKEFLSDSEQERYKVIYDSLVTILSNTFPYEAFEDLDTHEIPLKDTNHSIETEIAKDLKISRQEYMSLWQIYINANNLKQNVIDSDNASSIYDWPQKLEIPTWSEYDSMSLFNVVRLMVHEVWVHYINQDISESNNFRIRWAKNLEKEEGLATLMEWLLEGKSLASMKQAGYSFPTILISELLGGKAREDYIYMRTKMATKWRTVTIDINRNLRVMRGYPLNWPWAQRKDMSYGRWLLKIIDLLEKGNYSLPDFFVGKFSIEDIENGRIDSIVPKDGRKFPLLFPEMILYMYTHGRENFTHKKFVTYIVDKYKSVFKEGEIKSVETIQGFTKLKEYMLMWRIIAAKK